MLRPVALSVLIASTAGSGAAAQSFERIASFAVALNAPSGAEGDETSAEIVAASDDGNTLVYTDSPANAVGLVDITDPTRPRSLGRVPMGGEPTSVVVIGGVALVGVNTSESFTDPSGVLAVVDILGRTSTDACDLGGQPDSLALAPDGSFVAVAIENERDEDVDDGKIPQLPAGFVAIVPLGVDGTPDCAGMVRADLGGIADVAPDDPEPEFVDVNENGEIAVTLQENNHVAVLSRDGSVVGDFSAGEVTLEGVDTEEDGRIAFDGSATVRREPDAVKWLDNDTMVVANEGDYEGGSRGFTILRRDGTVEWDSAMSLEYEIAALGHYPEGRSDAKGNEPEGLEVATFGEETLIFVLSERSSTVAVYADVEGAPELLQILPSGVSPEGAVAIPERNLLATANEVDLREDGGPGSHVMIYEMTDAAPTYPTLVATIGGEVPTAWGAISGLVADPSQPAALFAVSDSALAPTIYVIDASQMVEEQGAPAEIAQAIAVTRDGAPAEKLDLEGVALDGEGGFWLANEGNADNGISHALLHVNGEGEIVEEVPFPDALLAGQTRFGAEGVAKLGDVLWVAVQRPWGDDPADTTKLLAYDLADRSWGAVRYPLEAAEAGWIGLSEITAAPDGGVYIVERDNQSAGAAMVKTITHVAADQLAPVPLGGELPTVTKTVVRDLLPDLAAWNGFTQEKVESFTIDSTGTAFIATDNDGVDDSTGETLFWAVPGFAAARQ